MQFKVGQLVRARHRTVKGGNEAHVDAGDLGLVAETLHKTTVHNSFQTYRVNWLPKSVTGDWWMRGAHLRPLDGMDNAV